MMLCNFGYFPFWFRGKCFWIYCNCIILSHRIQFSCSQGNCLVGHISNGNPRTSELQEGQQLVWECNSNFVQHPGNGESVCRNGSLVPQPECQQSKSIIMTSQSLYFPKHLIKGLSMPLSIKYMFFTCTNVLQNTFVRKADVSGY